MSGDGLIGQVGGALAQTGTPMGILPGGRGNDLGRVLGIPTEPAGAVAVLADGNEREIDVGVVNGGRFLCIASFGFDSDANRIANEARFVRGNLVYAYAALRTLAAWRPHTFTVDRGRRAHRVLRLLRRRRQQPGVRRRHVRGAGRRARRRAARRRAHRARGKLRFLRSLPQVFKGTQVDNEEIRMLRGAEVEVSADEDFAVYADGEHLADLPAKLRVLAARPEGDRARGPSPDPPRDRAA